MKKSQIALMKYQKENSPRQKMKKSQIALVGGTGFITGMTVMATVHSSSHQYDNTITPSPDQIQNAVDDVLLTLNNEDIELKEFLAEIQKIHPEVVGARYGYLNNVKYLYVAVLNVKGDTKSGVTEYIIQLDKTHSGKANSQLARELSSQSNCEPGYLFDDDDNECYRHVSNYSSWNSYSRTSYSTMDSYSTTTSKEKRIYSAQTVKKTSAERAAAIKAKASSDKTLSQQRQAFSTKRSSSRSSSMGFSSSRSWGG